MLETKLSHNEQNATKKIRSILENVYGDLNAIEPVSDADGGGSQDAGQQPENQDSSGEAQIATVVLPEGGPGEAARTPTEEMADEPEGDALKGRCDNPSL